MDQKQLPRLRSCEERVHPALGCHVRVRVCCKEHSYDLQVAVDEGNMQRAQAIVRREVQVRSRGDQLMDQLQMAFRSCDPEWCCATMSDAILLSARV
mmetsp:Transcript_53159/g.123918  ORF Transcript_53159/g.123918 Transcript_53159/m.123918 type:complete len:97 (-) Transcript_53159:1701-1991(-)